MEVIMNTKKIVFATLLTCISLSGISKPAFAGVYSKSDAISVNSCLKTSGANALRDCTKKIKAKNRTFRYFKTKGRNRNASNSKRGKIQKILYKNTKPAAKISKSFAHPIKGGLRIDACVEGNGWKISDGRRCDTLRLKKIGTSFCKSYGLTISVKVTKEAHKGRHAVLTYNKSRPNDTYWKKKKGRVAIKKIICK